MRVVCEWAHGCGGVGVGVSICFGVWECERVCLSVGECVWMATRVKLLEQEKIMLANAVYEG